MNQYLGKGISHIFGSEGYSYSKVIFNKGRPVLESELNLLQEIQEQLARRSTAEMPSGWITFRDFATGKSSQLRDSFLTQSPDGAIPEVALVNGWTVLVSNTGTDIPFVNKVDLSGTPLTKGSRVDGVFLEAWRAVVSEEFAGLTQPSDAIVNSSIYSVHAISDTLGWAVGANGVILKTDNGGTTWVSQKSPSSYELYSVVFNGTMQGYIAGANGTLLRTDNGGASWYKLAIPTTDDLLSVAVAGSTNVWVVGSNGTIFRSVDGVTFATPAVSRTNEDLRAVYFYDTMVGWAAGANGTLLKTQDGGQAWSKLSVTVPDVNGVENTVTAQLNDIKFVNLNDGWIVGNDGLILKTNDGGLRWANISSNVYDSSVNSYRSISSNLNAITFKKSLPLRITLGLYNPSTHKAATYQLTPTTVSLFCTRMDNSQFRVDLLLAEYATNADLVTAINAILDPVGGTRAFEASLGYADSSYESHLNQDTIYGSSTTEMRFSLGDKAWIAGDAGTMLVTSNSGAQWIPEDLGIAFDMYAASFSSFSTGWAVGANAAVSRYSSSNWMVQATSLNTTPQKRVYFEGNVNASVGSNLNFDSIDPSVKVPTADRVQIQYRIRVVEGVDIGSFQEAGLGSPYVYSQGPNANGRAAGSFAYESMGAVNGDYGLWRAKCKNTVDGYAYAIPMFLVSKRNSAPYNPNSNINGSTDETLFVVRPDDIIPGEIIREDIVDLRKTVSIVDTLEILQGTTDLLLEDRLRTKMLRSPELGTQVGSSLIRKDTINAESEIQSLLDGTYSAEAIQGITGFIGPTTGLVADPEGTLPTQDQLTFTTYTNSIWHPQPEYYTAKYGGTGDTGIDGTNIPGGFTGMGSAVVQFVLGATGIYNGYDNPGLTYIIAGRRIDYSRRGLSMSPDVPMSVRNPDSASTTKTAYYRSVQVGSAAQDISEAPASEAPGYVDYTEVVPSLGYEGTLASSMVRVHRFIQVPESTNVIRVDKEFNGFSCYAVSALRSTSGSSYRIREIRDREIPAGQSVIDASYFIIYLDDAYRIPAGTIIEVELEVCEVPPAGSVITPSILGISGTDRGESSDAFRNSYVSLVNKAVKGVQGFYRSVLTYSTTFSGSATVVVSTTDGSIIEGLPVMPTLAGNQSPYVWYTSSNLDAFANPNLNVWWKTVRIDTSVPITGLGTDTVSFALVSGENGINLSTSGSIIVPMLVRDTILVNNTSTSYAEVFYRTVVPQTVDSLPAAMSFEILSVSPSMYLSNLGFGGGLPSDLYNSPLKQISSYDMGISTESFYHNLFGLTTNSGIYEEGGLLTLPMHLYRSVGRPIELSGPAGDTFGRTFYTTSNAPLVFKAAGVSLPTPRKIFVPMVARVTSPGTSPVLRGEIVLLVASQAKNMELDNTLSINGTSSTASVSIYRVPGMPLTRG